uniref:Dopey_N domain-containing protein n=1 Tax=Heterorhabditis bacteriophora TaxID=37862 RepID=A0A1I7XQT0_HETBA
MQNIVRSSHAEALSDFRLQSSMMVGKKVRDFLMASSSGGGASGDGSLPNPLHNTSKYKAYAQAVDRALKTFENPNEWADLISALAKLAKVFQSNSKFGDIPKPVTVAKRLSQCLHPALPMGVHLKALETYRQIFDILGPLSLPKLLYLFAVGLFPLMDHCGIKVKSELFNIFEQYLLPLGQHLRPALPGFLAGVLLGLEEGTEFYERSLAVLDRVSDGVGACSFFACLWQAVLRSPSVRLPAMLYVNAKFDKSRPLDDQIAIVGDHVNHMVAALCATADDSGSPLVQRHLLDFLCSAFPLDSKNLNRENFVQLIRRCLFVVLRRDMSLNRRLYTWLMNPTGGAVAVSGIPVGDDRIESTFFHNHVFPLIIDALDEYLRLDIIDIPQVTANAWAHGWGDKKQYILAKQEGTSLTDKKDIESSIDRGPIYLPLNLNSSSSGTRLNAVEVVIEQKRIKERRIDEVSKTFNLLLSSLETGFLYEFLGDWFERLAGEVEPSTEQITKFAEVVLFCLDVCNMDSESVIRSRFLPKLLRRLLRGLSNEDRLDSIQRTAILNVIDVCSRLLTEISQRGAMEADVVSCGEALDTASVSSPKKIINRGVIDEDQSLMESCLSECLSLLSSVCHLYCSSRNDSRLPLLSSVCTLLAQFAEYPIYCLALETQINSGLPNWLDELLQV